MTAVLNPGWCLAYIQEMHLGVNDLLEDEIKMALYDNTRDLDADSLETYDTVGEIVGSGYTAGGAVATMALSRHSSILGVDLEARWNDLRAIVRSAVVYNTLNDRAVAVIDLEEEIIIDKGLTITAEKLPPYFGFVEEVI